ncbi:hypothetical protein OJAV_G00198230 [Oryzias javanicus]|uniref:XK-related protein n=1 Tax=Oryzias javanicus TaxID=123683 RepID=A0A437C7R6_ORYJA|nr:hypothetical protein OJAV_G00198230 [Oryzias javanicus]
MNHNGKNQQTGHLKKKKKKSLIEKFHPGLKKMCVSARENVLQEMDNIRWSKLRTIFLFIGFVLYLMDIGTDICLVLNCIKDGQYLWGGMTMMFVLTGTLSTQPFSYAWYRDDAGKAETLKAGVTALHMFGLGTIYRYYHLLKESWRVLRKTANSPPAEGTEKDHDHLFCMAADLCMLKVFEAFLESVPQLLLQVCIIQSQTETSFFRWLSVAFSLINVAHTLMDYSSYLRRSLPHVRGMPSLPSRGVYLLYKFFTLTSCILSYSLLITVSVYSTAVLTVLWLLLTVWVHFLKTNFCTSRALEFFYRAIVGAILVFTFFNVKGQDTKPAMTVYYILHAIINITAPILSVFLVPDLQGCRFVWTAGLIGGTTILGFMCLILYYSCLHPKGIQQEADEVDGLETEAMATRKMRSFLQP